MHIPAPNTIEIVASICFALAVLHTFFVSKFAKWAHRFPQGSFAENVIHFLAETEIVFGLWAAALFTAINKDSEEIWFELVPFDGGLAQRMSDRAVRVITATDSQELLPRHATTPTHVECKFCPWQDRCWGST